MNCTSREFAAESAGKVLVDIRRPEEWRSTGVIEGCHLLTFNNTDIMGWLSALAKIAKPTEDLVLICRSGHRTSIVLDFLRNQTEYRQAGHVTDGILGWIANGLPVVSVDD
jgi:rhodanese-related sulfurtransferase